MNIKNNLLIKALAFVIFVDGKTKSLHPLMIKSAILKLPTQHLGFVTF